MKFLMPLTLLLCFTLFSCANEEQSQREKFYKIAQDLIREQMKIPNSTRFPALPDKFEIKKENTLTFHNSDSVKFSFGGGKDSKAVRISGYYESQNSFGAFLPGEFSVMVEPDSTNPDKWVIASVADIPQLDLSKLGQGFMSLGK